MNETNPACEMRGSLLKKSAYNKNLRKMPDANRRPAHTQRDARPKQCLSRRNITYCFYLELVEPTVSGLGGTRSVANSTLIATTSGMSSGFTEPSNNDSSSCPDS
jgi:hypothetical protein